MPETAWPSGVAMTVNDNQYEQLAATYASDGWLISPALAANPVFHSATGLQVAVHANLIALVRGHVYASNTLTPDYKAITPNTSGQTRLDLVVLGLDRTTLQVHCYVKAGTPGAALPPALRRDPPGSGVFEIPMAIVTVANGAGVIASADIVNVATLIRPGAPVGLYSTAGLPYVQDPLPGQLVWVSSEQRHYLYRPASGWVRADWPAGWGVIGGKTYTKSTGSVLSFGVNGHDTGSTEERTGMDTGPVSVVAGRRYRINVSVRVWPGGADPTICLFWIRENTLTGAARMDEKILYGLPRLGPAPTFSPVLHTRQFSVEYDETLSRTVTFLLTFAARSPGGSIDSFYRSAGQPPLYMNVEDLGPVKSAPVA